MSAHHGKPLVTDTTLRFQNNMNTYEEIDIFSFQWFDWLNLPTSTGFHYTSQNLNFTARKEKRRKGHFWYAYKRIYGKLVKKYIGKSEKLTVNLLEETAKALSTTYEVQSNFIYQTNQ